MAVSGFRVSSLPMFHLHMVERQHRANATLVLRKHGIDHRIWRLLVILLDQGSRSINDLADFAGFERSTLSKIVDTAEKRGFVERRPNAADRRRSVVALTQIGHDMIDQAAPDILALFDDYFSAFSAGEVEDLMRLILKLRSSVELQGLHLKRGHRVLDEEESLAS